MDSIKLEIKGMETIIDVDDYAAFCHRSFHIAYGWNKTPYVAFNMGKKKLRLHRVIMGNPEGFFVDHINRNTLDNRKSNLRLATRSQNMANRISRTGSSKYKGVHWRPNISKWRAQIRMGEKGDKQLMLGYFDTEEEAALAYNAAALEKWGEYAFLNEVNHGK